MWHTNIYLCVNCIYEVYRNCYMMLFYVIIGAKVVWLYEYLYLVVFSIIMSDDIWNTNTYSDNFQLFIKHVCISCV